MLIGLTIAWHAASRLAYTGWVGVALSRQRREQSFTRDRGVAAGFRAFRQRAKWLMVNDAASFIALCVATGHSLPRGEPRGLVWPLSGLLMVLGVGTKFWAARALGADAYYWHNFFAIDHPTKPDPPGPYRYLSNPMYTVGYLQAYGFALALGSFPGLAAALFDQAAILLFHQLVEKPHYRELQVREESFVLASPSTIR